MSMVDQSKLRIHEVPPFQFQKSHNLKAIVSNRKKVSINNKSVFTMLSHILTVPV